MTLISCALAGADAISWEFVGKTAKTSPALARLTVMYRPLQTILQGSIEKPLAAVECFLRTIVPPRDCSRLTYAQKTFVNLLMTPVSPLLAIVEAVVQLFKILIAPMHTARYYEHHAMLRSLKNSFVDEREAIVIQKLIQQDLAKLELKSEAKVRQEPLFDYQKLNKIAEKKAPQIGWVLFYYKREVAKFTRTTCDFDKKQIETRKDFLINSVIQEDWSCYTDEENKKSVEIYFRTGSF